MMDERFVSYYPGLLGALLPFDPFLILSLNAGFFLVFLLSVKHCILLAQLHFQIMVLLGEELHGSGKSLNMSLEGGRAWFVSLNIVGCCH